MPFKAQTQLLTLLRRLADNKYSPWQEQIVKAGIRFVESTAWGLLWARLRYEHACQGSDISSSELADLESALREHFEPIQEEYEREEHFQAHKFWLTWSHPRRPASDGDGRREAAD